MHNFDESIPGFPTYGEFLNYTFRKTGLLATGDRFTETSEVKSFQKALNRLSDETGKIEDNFHKAFDELIECLAVEGLSKKYSPGLQGIFWDAIQQYGDLIRNEGTYLITGHISD